MPVSREEATPEDLQQWNRLGTWSDEAIEEDKAKAKKGEGHCSYEALVHVLPQSDKLREGDAIPALDEPLYSVDEANKTTSLRSILEEAKKVGKGLLLNFGSYT
eukprot:TRINITY_DN67200_c7_g8_i1.p2 TRINITY_DN67200_c7_g8~~TRINITY_DN67200_c7_g8_i1.p2  ORF type:complete len:121 (+),score=10.83 TRINITY_DN67200_c7_g8_i1:52-363(+)